MSALHWVMLAGLAAGLAVCGVGLIAEAIIRSRLESDPHTRLGIPVEPPCKHCRWYGRGHEAGECLAVRQSWTCPVTHQSGTTHRMAANVRAHGPCDAEGLLFERRPGLWRRFMSWMRG